MHGCIHDLLCMLLLSVSPHQNVISKKTGIFVFYSLPKMVPCTQLMFNLDRMNDGVFQMGPERMPRSLLGTNKKKKNGKEAEGQ